MNTITKIVYDKLASGGGIYLPDVGWLYVERDAARFISAREIRPPHNRVVFSRRQNPLLESVVDILARADGMEPGRAAQQYSRWLTESRGERGYVEINGVGVIKNNFFYPSVELHERLNPMGNQNLALRRRGREKTILIAAGIALVAVIVIFIVALSGKGDKKEPATKEVEIAAQIQAPAQSGSVREAVAEARASQKGESREKDMQQQPAATPQQRPAQANTGQAARSAAPATRQAPQTVGTTTYHVVVGIFDSRRNADKCVREDPAKIGSANYKIYTYRGTRLMVSAFESADKASAEARQRELKKHKKDAWVYARKE